MLFRQLFDPTSSSYTYLVADDATRDAVLIDPIYEHVERDCQVLDELGLRLRYVLETHIHADHVTGASRLRERLGARIVGSRAVGATCSDVLVGDGDEVRFGSHALGVLDTPGHTAGCVSYFGGDRVFTG